MAQLNGSGGRSLGFGAAATPAGAPGGGCTAGVDATAAGCSGGFGCTTGGGGVIGGGFGGCGPVGTAVTGAGQPFLLCSQHHFFFCGDHSSLQFCIPRLQLYLSGAGVGSGQRLPILLQHHSLFSSDQTPPEEQLKAWTLPP